MSSLAVIVVSAVLVFVPLFVIVLLVRGLTSLHQSGKTRKEHDKALNKPELRQAPEKLQQSQVQPIQIEPLSVNRGMEVQPRGNSYTTAEKVPLGKKAKDAAVYTTGWVWGYAVFIGAVVVAVWVLRDILGDGSRLAPIFQLALLVGALLLPLIGWGYFMKKADRE